MTDIDKIAREVYLLVRKHVNNDCGNLAELEIKSALESYANDYCDGLLFVIADIRQKTGVGDKPMLVKELSEVIESQKQTHDALIKKVNEISAQNAVMHEALESAEKLITQACCLSDVKMGRSLREKHSNTFNVMLAKHEKYHSKALNLSPSDAAEMVRMKDAVLEQLRRNLNAMIIVFGMDAETEIEKMTLDAANNAIEAARKRRN